VAKTFRCSIVTPEAQVMDDQVLYASFQAWDGQHGVMPGQSPLLTKLGSGPLRLDFPEGGSRWYLLDGGFAQIQDGSLALLTEGAMPSENINLQQAEAELAEANARVTAPGADRAAVERQQRRAMAKISLAKAVQQRGGAI
jgi:F-type H+-transporting ATPase subunit epsilon